MNPADETQPDEAAVVLYIDDDELNRHLMTRLFERNRPGDRLVLAASGAEGLSQARAGNVDLVLLDLTLPDMKGEDVLRVLSSSQSMPVVIVSGHSDPVMSQRLLAEGAAAYVAKPFDVVELFVLIDRLLS